MTNIIRAGYFAKIKVAFNKKEVFFFNLILLLFSGIAVLNNQENELKKFLEKFFVAKLHEYIKGQQFVTDFKLISKRSSS